MIDIVTVVFREEIAVLRTQAESIDLFCDPAVVENIIVVVNDSNDIVDLIDPAWWGRFQDRVQIVPRTLFNIEYSDNGWLSQQVLKMLGSFVSFNEWAMVMDAKTIIVRPVDKSLFDDQQRIRSGAFDIYEVFYPSRDIVNQLFDINLQTQLGPGGVPFFFKTAVLRQMISAVEARTGESFGRWFQAQGRLTEFILYSGYIELIQDNSYNQKDNALLPINICHSEVGIFDIKLNQMKISNPLTVSVHRRAWANISEQQRQDFRRLLIDRGLTSAGKL